MGKEAIRRPVGVRFWDLSIAPRSQRVLSAEWTYVHMENEGGKKNCLGARGS